jgi:hypothetical protein
MNRFDRESVLLSPYIIGGTKGQMHFTFCPIIKGTNGDKGDR